MTRRWAHLLLVVGAAGAVLVTMLLFEGTGQATTAANPRARPPDRGHGRELFLTQCSSCHGVDGKGLTAPGDAVRGPSLLNSGEASAYFYLSTGRMPLGASNQVPVRKPRAYSQADIDDLVVYVGSLGDGPKVPRVEPSKGDLATGGELFRSQCAACHSATGAGGALSYGRAAPSLGQANATELGSAVIIGPGQMPRFRLSKHQVDSLARYVDYLHHPDDRGGIALGRLGPIPEGFLVWVVGIGGLLVLAGWIGAHGTPRRAQR